MTLQLLHSEFPIYEENLIFFFISVFLKHLQSITFIFIKYNAHADTEQIFEKLRVYIKEQLL